MMNTHLTTETMMRFARKTLEPSQILDVDDHIAACEACRADLARLCHANAMAASLAAQFHRDPSRRLAWFPSSPVRPPNRPRHFYVCVV